MNQMTNRKTTTLTCMLQCFSYDGDDESDLTLRFHQLRMQENAICSPKYAQRVRMSELGAHGYIHVKSDIFVGLQYKLTRCLKNVSNNVDRVKFKGAMTE